jgi:adenosylhomocysteine nucleosidase
LGWVNFMSGGIVAVTSLALEARIAAGPGVSVICSQGERLAAALEAAVERGACGIISLGVAGGLAPGLAVGDLVAATAVITGQRSFPTDQRWTRSLCERLPKAVHADILGMDTLAADPEQKQLLYAQTGAAAVDMESHIAATIAAAHKVPFAVFRVIIDPADRPLPPAAIVGLRSDGTADVGAVFRSVLRQPSQLPALVRTALDARIAGAALRHGRRRLGAGLGFPDFGEGHRASAAKKRSSPFPELGPGFAVGRRGMGGLPGTHETELPSPQH